MKELKFRNLLLLLVVTLSLVGCNGVSSGDNNSDENKSGIPSESVSSSESEERGDSQVPSESETLSETEEPLENGWAKLTEDELKWFNEQFFNVAENGIVNAFLNCTYADVKDISMYELFYDCPSQSEVKITNAELNLLKQKWEEIQTDIQKVPTSYVDEMLNKYANIRFEDSGKVDLDKLVYLSDYNAYYSMHGDTHHSAVEVKSGTKDESGNVILQCMRVEDEKEYTVTLKAHENGYYFVSNLVTE